MREYKNFALANGCISHALDYDDCGVKIGHPSVLVLPAVLSLGEHLGVSGRDVLTVYIMGLEVEGKMALHADVPIWPGLADVGPDTEFVGNPLTIRTTDGRSDSAWVDIPDGHPLCRSPTSAS